MPALQQPEVYLGNAAQLINAQGALRDESTRAFLREFLEAFARWAERNGAK
jgi:chromate reductase